MKILFQLIHVSDFHFGDNLFPQAVVNTPGQITFPVKALETHDLGALEALSNSVRRIRQTSTAPISIIATGDLTSWGSVPSLELASKYLRKSINTGGPQQIGLADPDALVVPGNHDTWGIGSLDPIPQTPLPTSTRDNFDRYFNSASSHNLSGRPFPYRHKLYTSPLIYLYGLDSTRLYEYKGSHTPSRLADGFVDQQQLSELESLVNNEPDIPRLRIAALHHSLIYPSSWKSGAPKGNLLNPDEVLSKLQHLGFALALCGHSHVGFEGLSTTNIHVLTAGTAAQKVDLSSDEKMALLRPSVFLPLKDRNLRIQALKRSNEYKVYEFKTDPQIQSSLIVSVQSYSYVPLSAAFDKLTSAKSITL